MWRFVLKQQRLSFSACFSLLGQSIVIFSTRPTKRIGIEQPWLWPKYSTWGFTWPSPLMPFFKNSWKNAVARSTLPAGYCSKVLINDSKPGLCSRTRFLGGEGQMPPTSWSLINIASMDRGFEKKKTNCFFLDTFFFWPPQNWSTSKKGGNHLSWKKNLLRGSGGPSKQLNLGIARQKPGNWITDKGEGKMSGVSWVKVTTKLHRPNDLEGKVAAASSTMDATRTFQVFKDAVT